MMMMMMMMMMVAQAFSTAYTGGAANFEGRESCHKLVTKTCPVSCVSHT